MVVITRRACIVLSPSRPESRELADLRERTRRALNKPFKFEPKAVTPLWELTNPDPLVSLFKPFSPVTAITESPAVRDLRSELWNFSWRRVLPVVAVGSLLIATFTIWQALAVINRYPAALNQISPRVSHSTPNPTSLPSGPIVPSGTKLDTIGPDPSSIPATQITISNGQTNLAVPATSH